MPKTNYDERELKYISNATNFDDATSAFLARELNHIRATALQAPKAPLNAFTVFPVMTDIPVGAETATQPIYDGVGVAQIISNYSDDLPRVDVYAEENVVKIYDVGLAYGYSDKEVQNAAFARRSLSTMKAAQARRGVDVRLNEIAWKGDKAHNIIGFLNNENITEYTLAADGTGAKTALNTKTEKQVMRDINSFLESIPIATNQVEQANTLALAPAAYAHLALTRLENSDRTLLDFVRQTHPELTRILKIGELKGAADDGTDLMVAGYFDPTYIRFEIPERFIQKPVERRNLESVVNCVASTAGVSVFIPMAFAKAKGC